MSSVNSDGSVGAALAGASPYTVDASERINVELDSSRYGMTSSLTAATLQINGDTPVSVCDAALDSDFNVDAGCSGDIPPIPSNNFKFDVVPAIGNNLTIVVDYKLESGRRLRRLLSLNSGESDAALIVRPASVEVSDKMEGSDSVEALDTQNVWAYVVIGVLGVVVLGMIVKGSVHRSGRREGYSQVETKPGKYRGRFSSNIAF